MIKIYNVFKINTIFINRGAPLEVLSKLRSFEVESDALKYIKKVLQTKTGKNWTLTILTIYQNERI